MSWFVRFFRVLVFSVLLLVSDRVLGDDAVGPDHNVPDAPTPAAEAPGATATPPSPIHVEEALSHFVAQKADPASVQALVDLGEPGREAVAAWWHKRRRSAEAAEFVIHFAARCGSPCALLFMELLATNTAQTETADAIFALPPSEVRQRLVREGVQRAREDALKARFIAELGSDPGESAHSLVMSFVSSKNLAFRSAAMAALATVARPDDCFVLLRLLGAQQSTAGRESEIAKQALISALGVARCDQGAPALIQALGDPCCRERAVAALVNIGQPAASALSLVLKSGDRVRLGPAIEALLAIGALDGADLARSIATGTPELRAAARDLLIATRPKDVGETLASVLRGARVTEALSLLDVGVQLSPSESRIVLRESLRHPDETVRSAAVERIGKAGLTYATAELRQAATTDSSVAVRAAALVAIHRMADSSCLDVLEAAANREDERLRTIAIRAIADVGGNEQVSVLIPLLQTNSLPVREAAHHALVRLVGVDLPMASAEWQRYWQSYAAPRFSDPFAAAQRQALETGDGRIIRWVETGSGPTVLVFGGAPDGGSSYLRPIVTTLTDAFRVVLVDLPGTVSSQDLGDVAACSPDRDAADIHAVRVAIGADRVHVVGHSFGARVVVHYAHLYADVVETLTVLNESLPDLTPDGANVRTIAQTLPEPWKGDLDSFFSIAHDYSSDARRRILWRLLVRDAVVDDAVYRWLSTTFSPSGQAADRIAAAWAEVDTVGELAQLSMPAVVISNPGWNAKPVLSQVEVGQLQESGRIAVRSLRDAGKPMVDRVQAAVITQELMAVLNGK